MLSDGRNEQQVEGKKLDKVPLWLRLPRFPFLAETNEFLQDEEMLWE